jgi:thiamine biosynthesis lipoprotein
MRGTAFSRSLAPLLVLACLTSCRAGAPSGANGSLRRFSRTHTALGTTFRVTVYAGDTTAAQAAMGAAVERLDALDGILNPARPESEIAALNAAAGGAAVRVGDELFALLVEAQRLAKDSDGAFDVTAGPYIDLWRRAAAGGTAPTAAELSDAKLRVGWQNLRLDAIEHTAALGLPGMRVDLSGIAHGYAADELMRELGRYGCERASVSAGNVQVVGGPPPGQNGWRVELREAAVPRGPATMELSNAAVAFSPNARRAGKRGGVTAGRDVQRPLIDPQSGRVFGDRPTVVAFTRRGGAAAESFAAAAAVIGDPGSGVLTRSARGARFRFAPAPGKRRS